MLSAKYMGPSGKGGPNFFFHFLLWNYSKLEKLYYLCIVKENKI